EVAVAIGSIGSQREAALDERDRFVTPPLLLRQDAGIVQSVRVIRSRFEDAAIQLPGFRELIVLLEKDRDPDRLVYGELARGGRLEGGHETRYPTLFALRSYLKCTPASSEPSCFCALYSNSTFANARLNVSVPGWPLVSPCATPVMMMSFILMIRYSC